MASTAQRLATTDAMSTFRDAERAFVIVGGTDGDVFESAVRLAEHARQCGALPEDILAAMRLAGCIRSDDILDSDAERASRYWIALSAVLRSYFDISVVSPLPPGQDL